MMSNEPKKTRINYVVGKDWEGNWFLSTDKRVPMESIDDALSTVKALYMLEDHANIDVTVSVTEVDGVNKLFGLE
jgi:hypothetical protein